MIEIMIERWKQRDGRTDFLWSIWRNGKREAMSQPIKSAEEAERAARAACRDLLACEPDRVTLL